MILNLEMIAWLRHQKAQGTNKKIDELDCLKIKSFCAAKGTNKKVKR